MALLQAEGLAKSFGILELFANLSFSIERGQKVGLIAPNGAGKSTLLNVLVGKEPSDAGSIVTEKGTHIAYLPQKSHFQGYPTIYAACLSGIRPELRHAITAYEQALQSNAPQALSQAMLQMDALSAWEVEHQLTSLLGKLNIHSPNRSPEHLSGGEEKRVALAATLLGNPDLIIMDEPTNHLDPSIIEWLEGHLSASNLSLLIVTHDRYFLDSVCDTIFELDNGTLYTYQGNYTHYLQKRAERLEQLEAEQQSLRNTYRRELEWMRRQPQARGTKARSRIDAFHQLEGQLGQISTPKGPQIEAQQVYIGKKIFEARQLSKSYGNKEVIKNFTYTFARHDRVGIVGPNGAGKSTLVKLILGQIPPTSGTIEIGETVRFGYFAQQPFSFPPQKKVIEVVTDIADEIEHSGGHSLSALQILTRFLFPPKRQQDYVANLSGGELRRLQLCTVLIANPNFLVLDEPTNDLDIPTLQVLEEYLAEFNGCLLIVSHDRYFMDRLTEHLFVLEGDGSVRDFPGNFTTYRLTKKEEAKEASTEKTPSKPTPPPRTHEKKKKRTYKEEQEFKALEAEIPLLEEQLATLEEQMSSGTLSPEELHTASAQYQTTQEALNEKEFRWLELSELE